MGRRSSIKNLPVEVKAAIDKAINEDRFTLDEILEAVREQFPQTKPPSRTALHNYRTNVEEQMAKVRETREIAGIWAQSLQSEPESDMSSTVIEWLRTMSFRAGSDMLNSEEPVNVKAMTQLARVIEQTENAHRMSVATRKAVREATLVEAEEAIDKLGAGDGKRRPDADTLAMIKAAIRGEPA